MVIAVTQGETWEWLSKEDRKLDPQTKGRTKCTFRMLGAGEHARLLRILDEPEKSKGDYAIAVFRAGTENVEDLLDGDGVEVPFESIQANHKMADGSKGRRPECSLAFVDRLPIPWLIKAADEIIERNTLKEDELGN